MPESKTLILEELPVNLSNLKVPARLFSRITLNGAFRVPVQEDPTTVSRLEWLVCTGAVPSHKDTLMRPWVTLLCIANTSVKVAVRSKVVLPSAGSLIHLKAKTTAHWTEGGSDKWAVFLAFDQYEPCRLQFMKAYEELIG